MDEVVKFKSLVKQNLQFTSLRLIKEFTSTDKTKYSKEIQERFHKELREKQQNLRNPSEMHEVEKFWEKYMN